MKAVLPFATERRTALLVDAKNHEELTELIGTLPLFRSSTFEVHAITTPENVLKVVLQMERNLQQMS